ncbi:MAG: transposase [Candidatus Limnocylindria bacterium]
MRTKAIAEAKIKTDKVDARTLAQLLAADFIPEVWIPDELTRRLRRQIAQRAALVRQQTQLRNRIHGILLRNLCSAPVTDLFGVAGRRWLAELALPSEERAQVDAIGRLLEPIAAEIAACERTLAAQALGDPRALRLMTLPGIGAISALAIAGVVGDVRRFPRPNKLASYLGLDPKVRQSGAARRTRGTSAARGKPTPGGCSSRRPMPRRACRARCVRSSIASARAAAIRSRSSPSHASFRSWPGICSAGSASTAWRDRAWSLASAASSSSPRGHRTRGVGTDPDQRSRSAARPSVPFSTRPKQRTVPSSRVG